MRRPIGWVVEVAATENTAPHDVDHERRKPLRRKADAPDSSAYRDANPVSDGLEADVGQRVHDRVRDECRS